MGDFTVLKEWQWEDASMFAQHLDILKKLLKPLSFVDPSLLKAMHSALFKAPTERGSFDTMVVQQLGDDINKHIASLDEQLAKAAREIAQQTRAVDAAQTAFNTATGKKVAAVEDFMARNAERKKLEAALHEAKKAVDEHPAPVKELTELHQSNLAVLSHVQDIQGKLVSLRDRK